MNCFFRQYHHLCAKLMAQIDEYSYTFDDKIRQPKMSRQELCGPHRFTHAMSARLRTARSPFQARPSAMAATPGWATQKPSEPPKSSGTYRPPQASRSPLLPALLALALLAPQTGWSQPGPQSSAPSAQRALPSLGDGGGMNLGEERDLGDRIARELYRDPSAVDDPILSEYLDQIWQRLLAAARQRGEMPPELDARMAWRVVQIRDRSVNAFALPGGYLGIQYGLIAATQDRDELATVMGHELSHVTQRHIARSLDQQSKLSPLVLATLVVGAIAASKNPAAGQAIMVGSQAAAIQKGLNFSRDMEREADRIGYAVMAQAGYAPEGAVRMFERLQAASRLNDSGAWPYLRTHPLTTERIGDMQSRQALRQGTRPVSPVPDDLEHQMMAARARVLAETGVDELRTATRLPDTRDFASQTVQRRAAMLYEAAMAHAALRDWGKARQTAAQLAELVKGQETPSAQARLLQADLAWRAGDAAAALALLPAPAAKSVSGSLSAAEVLGSAVVDQANWRSDGLAPSQSGGATTPGIQGRSAVLWRAMAQLQVGQATGPRAAVAEATSALQSWVASHPNDALAWQTLSQAWEAQGNRLRALRAQAEARIAQADWPGARDRLQAAQEATRKSKPNTPGEHIEASIIDTRLQQASEKVRQQAEADARR
jgi:predicted Zn-dependent protease